MIGRLTNYDADHLVQASVLLPGGGTLIGTYPGSIFQCLVRYVEKRWIPRDRNFKSSQAVREERILDKVESGTRSAGYVKCTENVPEERKSNKVLNNFTSTPSIQNGFDPESPKVSKQVN